MKLEKTNRDNQAKILNLKEQGKISTAELIAAVANKTIEAIASIDFEAANFLMRKIATIETEIGDGLLDLFEDFMKNLSPDREKIRKIQDEVDHAERLRNKVFKRLTDFFVFKRMV